MENQECWFPSLDAYKKYERNEDGTGAWLWEHQALTRGRFSAGDVDIGRGIRTI